MIKKPSKPLYDSILLLDISAQLFIWIISTYLATAHKSFSLAMSVLVEPLLECNLVDLGANTCE